MSGVLIVLLFYCLPSVLAQEATEEAVPAQEATEEAVPTGEQKARQILEAVREKIKAKQMEPKRRAYVGTLKSIADTTLVLETKNGIKQAEVDPEAIIVRISGKTKKEIKFEDLTIGELTIAMGYLGENEVLETKRVVMSEKPEEETQKEAVYGTVEEIDLEEKIVVIKELKKETLWSLKVTSKTEIGTKSEGEVEETELEEIKTDDRLIVIGLSEEEENILTAIRIHILPGKSE